MFWGKRQINWRWRHLFTTLALMVALPAHGLDINILYLKQKIKKPPALSNILPEPKDSGLQGARMALKDNNSAGRFLKQKYTLEEYQSRKTDKLFAKARDWIAAGNAFIVADLPADTLLKLTEDPALIGKAVIFNASAPDNDLRTRECRTALLHTGPSRAMLTDALMQFLVKKRWKNWALIKGGKNNDTEYAESLKHSSKRFGAKLVVEKTWSFDTDLRRSAGDEVPAFTQFDDYDVLIIADEDGDFGEYVLYNTWHPRPVAGTQGLRAVAWHRAVEQWGAAQLQKRFDKLAKRWMNSRDYGAWLAIRSIGEAVTRTNSAYAKIIYNYLLSDEFEMAGFKGRKMNFRPWNGQMRQPIPLIHSRAVVSNTPIPEFLHPRSELDSLGYDKPEVTCSFKTTL